MNFRFEVCNGWGREEENVFAVKGRVKRESKIIERTNPFIRVINNP